MSLHTTLIDAATLAAMPPDKVLIVDCRADPAGAGATEPDKPEREYREAHIPGAVHASLERDLSDLGRKEQGLGRHPLPLEKAFSAVLGRWGWQPGLQVVAYDAGSSALAAARLWWLLRLAGVRGVAVLDGGLAAWRAAGLPLESGAVERTPTQVDLRFDAAQAITDHSALHAEPAPVLLDARAAARYRGEQEPIDPKAGHIPGAVNRPSSANVDAHGRFRSPDALRRELSELLDGRDAGEVIAMCGSGVTACQLLLALAVAGLGEGKLYAGSWSEWIRDPDRPVARGPG